MTMTDPLIHLPVMLLQGLCDALSLGVYFDFMHSVTYCKRYNHGLNCTSSRHTPFCYK